MHERMAHHRSTGTTHCCFPPSCSCSRTVITYILIVGAFPCICKVIFRHGSSQTHRVSKSTGPHAITANSSKRMRVSTTSRALARRASHSFRFDDRYLWSFSFCNVTLDGLLFGFEASQPFPVCWDGRLLLLRVTCRAMVVCTRSTAHAPDHEEHRKRAGQHEQDGKGAYEELRSHHAYEQGNCGQADQHFPVQAHLHA